MVLLYSKVPGTEEAKVTGSGFPCSFPAPGYSVSCCVLRILATTCRISPTPEQIAAFRGRLAHLQASSLGRDARGDEFVPVSEPSRLPRNDFPFVAFTALKFQMNSVSDGVF